MLKSKWNVLSSGRQHHICPATIRASAAEWGRGPLHITDKISPHKKNTSLSNFVTEEQTFLNIFI